MRIGEGVDTGTGVEGASGQPETGTVIGWLEEGGTGEGGREEGTG